MMKSLPNLQINEFREAYRRFVDLFETDENIRRRVNEFPAGNIAEGELETISAQWSHPVTARSVICSLAAWQCDEELPSIVWRSALVVFNGHTSDIKSDHSVKAELGYSDGRALERQKDDKRSLRK
jgi:hypothetical protein